MNPHGRMSWAERWLAPWWYPSAALLSTVVRVGRWAGWWR